MLFLTKYLRPLALCAAAVTLVGCTTIKPQAIEARQLERLKNQTVASTSREKPDFMMSSPGTMAVGGLIGALIAVSAGNKLIADNDVEDPANAISAGLLRVLEAHQGTRQVAPAMPTTSNDPQKLASTGKGKAKFVLDVETTGWMATYFPSAMSRYRVIYGARARLIDVETQALIAEGGCKRETGFGDAPTQDELWANKAAVMKKESSLTVQECVEAITLHMVPAALPLAEALASAPKTAVAASPTPVAAPAAPTATPLAVASVPSPAAPSAAPVTSVPPAAAPVAAPAAVQRTPVATTVAVASPPQPAPAQPAPAATAAAAAPASASKKESRLQWLKQMHDAKLISTSEYEAKRQQVMSAP